jgi:hypothetical protein
MDKGIVYGLGPSDFAEDHLPADQPPIMTSNVTRLEMYLRLTTGAERVYRTIAVISGPSGVGKTIATGIHAAGWKIRAHTGMSSGVRLKLKPQATPRSLGEDLMTGMAEKPSRDHSRYKRADEAASAIDRNDINEVLIDNADELNTDTFNQLCFIFDKTGCSFVLVGLENFKTLIEKHPKFESRCAAPFTFGPLPRKEIVTKFLPKLVIPRWEYHVENEKDLQMGEYIWERVGSSLRNLRNLIQMASQVAREKEEAAITMDTIDIAQKYSRVARSGPSKSRE